MNILFLQLFGICGASNEPQQFFHNCTPEHSFGSQKRKDPFRMDNMLSDNNPAESDLSVKYSTVFYHPCLFPVVGLLSKFISWFSVTNCANCMKYTTSGTYHFSKNIASVPQTRNMCLLQYDHSS